jgi:hypothetical protein
MNLTAALRGDFRFPLRVTAPLMNRWQTVAAAVTLIDLADD